MNEKASVGKAMLMRPLHFSMLSVVANAFGGIKCAKEIQTRIVAPLLESRKHSSNFLNQLQSTLPNSNTFNLNFC